MRLKNYLTEGPQYRYDPPTLRGILEKECKTMLKMYLSRKPLLWRGTLKAGGQTWIEKKSHLEKGRKPVDTPQWIHNELNKMLKQKFGWPVRDGIPATISQKQAEYYGGGKAHVFFPTDPFKYAYFSEASDYYMWFSEIIQTTEHWFEAVVPLGSTNNPSEKGKEYIIEILESSIKDFHNSNYEKAVGEIFFNSKKYYLVDHWLLTVDLYPDVNFYSRYA